MSGSEARKWMAVPRFTDAAVTRARLVAVPRVRRRAARVPFVILVTVVLLGGIVGLLLFNTSMQQAAFTGADLEERVEVLTAREQTLVREIEQMRDPQRLAEAATAQGMVPAPAPALIDLGTGDIVVAGEPATAEDGLDIAPEAPVKPAELSPAPVYVDLPAAPETPQTPATGETPATDGTAVAPGTATPETPADETPTN